MSKRVHFDESSILPSKTRKTDDEASSGSSSNAMDAENTCEAGIWPRQSRLSKHEHTLDSDEEDDAPDKNQFEKLNEEDIEGAEDGDVGDEFDALGEGKYGITPFNLREEMEEGDFDRDGCYHFKKDREIRDNWLDGIDWVQIKKSKGSRNIEMDDDDDDDDDSDGNADFDEMKILESILQLVKKGESVSKALRRLGGSSEKKKRVWKREKVYDLEEKDETEEVKSEGDHGRGKAFLDLTELADRMAGAGHYDIYSDTFEKLNFKFNNLKRQKCPNVPDDVNDDDALDMFADVIDKEGKKTTTPSVATESPDEVMWEYKWAEDKEETYGPFSTQQMTQWKDAEFFKAGVVARKVGVTAAPFYSVARIDFDLYD